MKAAARRAAALRFYSIASYSLPKTHGVRRGPAAVREERLSPAPPGAVLGIAAVRDAAVRLLHEFLEPVLKVLIAAGLPDRRKDPAVRDRGGGALRTRAVLLPRSLLPRLLEGALDGEIDLPIVGDAENP